MASCGGAQRIHCFCEYLEARSQFTALTSSLDGRYTTFFIVRNNQDNSRSIVSLVMLTIQTLLKNVLAVASRQIHFHTQRRRVDDVWQTEKRFSKNYLGVPQNDWGGAIHSRRREDDYFRSFVAKGVNMISFVFFRC
jgi:hypothetical protein